MRIIVVLAATLTVLSVYQAQAASEIFTKPTYKGVRLAWCKAPASGCGKAAANAYCAFLGFGDATDYVKEEGIKPPSRFIGTNQSCEKSCDGFKTISCGKALPDKKTFDKPRWKGSRLDFCMSKNVGCGKEAADKFCKSEGYGKATSFSPDPRIGLTDPTRMIGSGNFCNTVICDGFREIICAK